MQLRLEACLHADAEGGVEGEGRGGAVDGRGVRGEGEERVAGGLDAEGTRGGFGRGDDEEGFFGGDGFARGGEGAGFGGAEVAVVVGRGDVRKGVVVLARGGRSKCNARVRMGGRTAHDGL